MTTVVAATTTTHLHPNCLPPPPATTHLHPSRQPPPPLPTVTHHPHLRPRRHSPPPPTPPRHSCHPPRLRRQPPPTSTTDHHCRRHPPPSPSPTTIVVATTDLCHRQPLPPIATTSDHRYDCHLSPPTTTDYRHLSPILFLRLFFPTKQHKSQALHGVGWYT
ncbi:extensin-like [Helianthus annuus]|uniref:extensin-like n=1 Tax=Helianthus annuus TaxID=4232 RepID=UPI00165326F6|nr:extensin-like [Helianthus annuus]